MEIKHYPKYLLFLDAFGLTGLVSAIFYVLLPATNRPEEHFDSLWGNLTTELLGIWVGVRFIEWIIRSHESRTKVRVRVVRNMRYTENLLHQLLDFRRPYHLIQLYRELDWIQRRLTHREAYLEEDERLDVANFYSQVSTLVSNLPSRTDAEAVSNSNGLIQLNNLLLLYEMLRSIEDLRRIAETNILEETNEDDGM